MDFALSRSRFLFLFLFVILERELDRHSFSYLPLYHPHSQRFSRAIYSVQYTDTALQIYAPRGCGSDVGNRGRGPRLCYYICVHRSSGSILKRKANNEELERERHAVEKSLAIGPPLVRDEHDRDFARLGARFAKGDTAYIKQSDEPSSSLNPNSLGLSLISDPDRLLLSDTMGDMPAQGAKEEQEHE